MKSRSWRILGFVFMLMAPAAGFATVIGLLPLPYMVKHAAIIGTIEITKVVPLTRSSETTPCGYRYYAKMIDSIKGDVTTFHFISGSSPGFDNSFIGKDRRYFLIAFKYNDAIQGRDSNQSTCAIPSNGYYILPGERMLFPFYGNDHKQDEWLLVEKRGGVEWPIAKPGNDIEIAYRATPVRINDKYYTAIDWHDFRRVVITELKASAPAQ